EELGSVIEYVFDKSRITITGRDVDEAFMYVFNELIKRGVKEPNMHDIMFRVGSNLDDLDTIVEKMFHNIPPDGSLDTKPTTTAPELNKQTLEERVLKSLHKAFILLKDLASRTTYNATTTHALRPVAGLALQVDITLKRAANVLKTMEI